MPDEPIEIATRPQLFVDDYLVDNRYAARGSAREMVLRKFYTPIKHGDAPVLVDPVGLPTHPSMKFDREAKVFRLWYQANVALGRAEKKKGSIFGHRHLRYAESKDGVHWVLPELGLFEFRGTAKNNICLIRPGLFTDPRLLRVAASGISSPQLLNEEEMPEADRRGYKYLLTYTQRGGGKREEDKIQVFLIGSHDGISLGREHQMSICTGAISDGWMGIKFASAAMPAKPNVLFIVVNDFRDWVGYSERSHAAKTPHIRPALADGRVVLARLLRGAALQSIAHGGHVGRWPSSTGV